MTAADIKVKDIMMDPILIQEDSTFFDALKLMMERKVNTLLVVDSEGVLVGEVSVVNLLEAIVPDFVEEDTIAAHYMSQATFEQEIEEAKDVPVSKFVNKNRESVEENASLMEVAVVAMDMSQARVPVVNKDKKPVGVVTRRGLKKIVAAHLGIDWDN